MSAVSWHGWKWGFWARIGRLLVQVMGPNDPASFSERNGYIKPLLKAGKWRAFVSISKEATK